MTTYSALATLTGESEAALLGEDLERLSPGPTGVGVFEIEDGSGRWEVGAYFEEAPDLAGLALLASLRGASDFVVSKVEPTDWVAQVRRELTPVRAGRFLVHGGHDAAAAADARHPLLIEAAMAFGTGHHGTTRGCLNAIDWLGRRGFTPRRVADIGCGTGVLAMAAAALWRAPVIASDIDPVATATAAANLRANRIPGVQAMTSVGFQAGALRRRAPFDLILANILARPLRHLAPDMARHTAPGAVIVLSGILNSQADGVERVYKGWRFHRLRRTVDGEWTTLILRRA